MDSVSGCGVDGQVDVIRCGGVAADSDVVVLQVRDGASPHVARDPVSCEQRAWN